MLSQVALLSKFCWLCTLEVLTSQAWCTVVVEVAEASNSGVLSLTHTSVTWKVVDTLVLLCAHLTRKSGESDALTLIRHASGKVGNGLLIKHKSGIV